MPYPRSCVGPIDPLNQMYKGIHDSRDSDVLCVTFSNGGVLLFDLFKRRLGSTYGDLITYDNCHCRSPNDNNNNINNSQKVNQNHNQIGIAKKIIPVTGNGLRNWCVCSQDKCVLQRISECISTPHTTPITVSNNDVSRNNSNMACDQSSSFSMPSAAVLPPWPGGICVVSNPLAGQTFSLKLLDLSQNPTEVREGEREREREARERQRERE